jgi:hypothetical protein
MAEMSVKRNVVVVAIVSFVFAALPTSADADVLIGNLPGNDGTYTSLNGSGGSIDSKAAGFTMPAGTDYFLDQVVLRMRIMDAANAPVVAIWSDSGGTPSAVLETLTNPAFTAGVVADYVFTPPSQVTLTAGQTYWIVVHNQSTGADSFHWMASSPGQTPTGTATSAGYLFDFTLPPPVTPSGTSNSYQVEGSLVPVELMSFTVE